MDNRTRERGSRRDMPPTTGGRVWQIIGWRLGRTSQHRARAPHGDVAWQQTRYTLGYLSDPHLLSSDARAAEFGAPFFFNQQSTALQADSQYTPCASSDRLLYVCVYLDLALLPKK